MAYRFGSLPVIIILILEITGCRNQAVVLYKGKPTRYWLRQLQDRDPATSKESVTALQAIGSDGHPQIMARALAAALLDSIHYPDRYAGTFQVQVIYALQKIGPVETSFTVPALIQALKDSKSINQVREAAVICLGSFGPKARIAEPVLRDLLNDSNHWIHSPAEEALKSILGAGAAEEKAGMSSD